MTAREIAAEIEVEAERLKGEAKFLTLVAKILRGKKL